MEFLLTLQVYFGEQVAKITSIVGADDIDRAKVVLGSSRFIWGRPGWGVLLGLKFNHLKANICLL
jgi:hypothetical protein